MVVEIQSANRAWTAASANYLAANKNDHMETVGLGSFLS
jgi:hypothetical protein